MKKVSIFLILLTITMTVIQVDEIKDLIIQLSICLRFYFFGLYVSQKFNRYLQKRKFEKDFESIFTDEFLDKLKKEIALMKIKNELEKIRRSKLCSHQPEQEDIDKPQNI